MLIVKAEDLDSHDPVRYDAKNNGDGTYTLTPAPPKMISMTDCGRGMHEQP